MFTSLVRIVKFAFQNFWRNFWLSIVTVSMLTLTLLVINILVVLHVLGRAAVRSVEERIDVTVSFKPETTAAVLGDVRSYLASLSQVTEVRTITADEALEAFHRRHEDNPQILRSLDEVGGNPFGPTLVIRARTAADYPFIFEVLENPTYRPAIQDKNFTDHKTLIDRITRITDRLRNFGVALAAIFAAITILLIFNTIRVAIHTHREEIGIMKLVGASNWFVRAPFLFESVLYGLIAVAITMAIVFPVLAIFEPYATRFFDGAEIGLLAFFRAQALVLFGGQLLFLIVLNIVSSSVAVGRYLRA